MLDKTKREIENFLKWCKGRFGLDDETGEIYDSEYGETWSFAAVIAEYETEKDEKQTPKRTLYPLVTHYSFDSEVPVWLFDTEEEAIAELRRQFEEEKRIELEENERTEGEDIFFKISDDGTYASITHVICGNEPDDVTEWTVGVLRN